MRWLLPLVLVGCATPMTPTTDAAAPSEPFIALSHDFAGYESWERIELVDAASPGEPDGPRWIYRNHAPPSGATAYPAGTMLVKVIRPSDDPSTWVVFAMAKRGAGFNSDGALGWEWFRLTTVDAQPVISWRGESPPAGMGYSIVPDGGIIGACNACHSLLPTHDFVLDTPFGLHQP